MFGRLLQIVALRRRLVLPLREQFRDAPVAWPERRGLTHRFDREVGLSAFVRDLSEQNEGVGERGVEIDRAFQRRQRRLRSSEGECGGPRPEIEHRVPRMRLQRLAEDLRRAVGLALLERRPPFRSDHVAPRRASESDGDRQPRGRRQKGNDEHGAAGAIQRHERSRAAKDVPRVSNGKVRAGRDPAVESATSSIAELQLCDRRDGRAELSLS